ncbi:MAG TPA: HU family DNA-binding protein [Gammaproteobacteria bacterium]|nr:HU family DNA-binding protein [Gammaproteobacteria bacterium]
MNKAQLIDAIAVAADLPKTVASKALDAVLDCISKSLAQGDMVALMGFGTFAVKERAARAGRNPKTGAEIHIKAAKVPTFKAGKALKDVVDQTSTG